MIPEPLSGGSSFQICVTDSCCPCTLLLNLVLLIGVFQESIYFHERGLAR